VEYLGAALPYADGAEDEIGAIFSEVADRSSSSDALAARVHDWPTRYHLSRQRSNLLRPLTLAPGMRVLDVGAGTGALSRYLGEQGADVVALEGSSSRAEAAAVRCADLANVRVLCGSVDDLEAEAPFDLVVVVGVLEYAGHAYGGAAGPTAFLDSIRRLTAHDGALVLAIENQLGLKYLLGCVEDHLGVPWVGVEGYRRPGGIRTYSRHSLSRLLDAAGLPPRRWLYPFPDYKLPSVVLSQRCFSEPDADLLVDQLVRTPVVDHVNRGHLVCDARAAAATFLEAGLSEDVANSFLVLAGDASAVGRLVDEDVLAWHFGSERFSLWLRTKRVVRRDGTRTIETVPRLDVARQRSWLSQRIVRSEPFVAGPTLERLALGALAEHDIASLTALLEAWHEHVLVVSTEVGPEAEPPTHPFRRLSTRHVLPEDHLDIELANFIRDFDGTLHYVDSEWCASGGVDLDLALTRALWSFAHRLVLSGAEFPWSPATTVDELAVQLGSLCGFAIGPALLDDFRKAEYALQELVVGLDLETGTRQMVVAGRYSQATFPVLADLPPTTLRGDLVRLDGELEALRRELTATKARAEAAEHDCDAVRRESAEATAELERVRRQLAEAMTSLSAMSEELAHHRTRAAQFERRLLVRTYRRALRRSPPV
jgi:2-polyprenyl-3-methyl-5-hydroxy-6-metoxy-1,4-benzoquinol methylase